MHLVSEFLLWLLYFPLQFSLTSCNCKANSLSADQELLCLWRNQQCHCRVTNIPQLDCILNHLHQPVGVFDLPRSGIYQAPPKSSSENRLVSCRSVRTSFRMKQRDFSRTDFSWNFIFWAFIISVDIFRQLVVTTRHVIRQPICFYGISPWLVLIVEIHCVLCEVQFGAEEKLTI